MSFFQRAKQALAKTWLLEIVIVLVVVSSYASGVLKFGIENRLPGNETELFTVIGWFLHNSVVENHQLPIWNPYLHTGLPYLGDPMLYIYNPLVGLPVILWGGWDGFKVGVFLSFLAAALGMLWLCKVLGLGRLTSLWAVLIYTFAGQPVARFFQGEYLFVFGFAWIPWIVASLFMVVQTGRRRYIILLALFLALLYMSGNAYYPFLMLFVVALFWFSHLIFRKKAPPFVRIDIIKTKRLAVAGVLALGLISVQLLPNLEFWPHMSKGSGAIGSHTIRQIYLDYTSKDTVRPDAYQDLPAREEFYAYIGIAPFLALFLLPLAFRQHHFRTIIFLLLVVGFVIIYIDLRAMPWHDLYEKSRFLSQFRHLLRPLIFGSFAILLLGALGLDGAWKLFDQRSELTKTSRLSRIKSVLLQFPRMLLLIFIIVTIWDVYATNKVYVQAAQMPMPPVNAAYSLRQYDGKIFYTRFNPNNAGVYGLLANHLRFIDAWYHWSDIRDLDGNTSIRQVQAHPNYVIQGSSDPTPEGDGVKLIQQVEGLNIFYLPESLPFAFKLNSALLATTGPELTRSMVDELLAFQSGPGRIELIASAESQQTLVVLVTSYPGWRVSIDGKEESLINVGGYLATNMMPGTHKYIFSYHPIPFYIGLVISLISLAICLTILAVDSRSEFASLRLSIVQASQNFSGAIRKRRQQWQAARARRRFNSSAIYHANMLELENKLPLIDGSRVQLSIEELPIDSSPLRKALHHWLFSSAELISQSVHAISLPWLLFFCALLLYLIVRLWRLIDFPIYFFTDEAIPTMLARDLIHNHFRNYAGDFLPAFFENGGVYRLGTTVYLQILPYLLLGKSLWVSRAVSVVISMGAAVAVGLILRQHCKISYWWSGVLFLSITPAWFLHSRTAFEYSTAVAFYALFLYFYLQYRYTNPRFLYLALVVGALSFYSYSPFQVILVISGVLLALSDARYHWQHRGVGLRGLILLGLLVIPYLRFWLAHERSNYQSLLALGSYLVYPMPLVDKVHHYFAEYLHGLNPVYWFDPNLQELERHVMKGYGHLLLVTLPFFALGLFLAIKGFRSSANRAILIALVAAPSGAALVQLGVTRALVMVIPAALLTTLGVDRLMTWLETRHLRRTILSVALFILLSFINLAMLRDALVNGPRWFSNYGLTGMQYGASQVFPAVIDYQKSHPEAKIVVSPNWANGTDVLARFFSTSDYQIELGVIDRYMFEKKPLDENLVFVMTPDEYNKAVSSGKFDEIKIDKILPYPDGRPGFFFVRLKYIDKVDEIFASEAEARSVLQEGEVIIDGDAVQVDYSLLDMGTIDLLFDGNKQSVARTLEANPFIIELTFPEARTFSGYKMFLSSADIRVTSLFYPAENGEPYQSVADFDGSPSNPELDVDFGESVVAQKVRFEVLQPYSGVPSNVHIWEIEFK